MKNVQLLIVVMSLIWSLTICAQETPTIFDTKIEQANTAYNNKDFKLAGRYYDTAFSIQKGTIAQRYDAVCTWSRANDTDKAMKELFEMANVDSFSNFYYLQSDMDFEPLRKSPKWAIVCKKVSENRFLKEPNLNRSLVSMLDTINFDDQYYRKYSDILEEKYGGNSEEVKKLWDTIAKKDAINLIKIKNLLLQKGWPSIKEIGNEGSSRIFLVIQHASLKDQIELLPIVQAAHKEEKLQSHYFAMLEDRIAIRQGKMQTYGTQIGIDKAKNDAAYLIPVIDPDNLDKRRAAVGLPPIADYLKMWDAEWDLQAYKKELPHYLELLKKNAEK